MSMSKSINWKKLDSFLLAFSEALSQTASEPVRVKDDSSTVTTALNNDNPLLLLPFDIRENISTEYYETGMSSMAQRYVEKNYLQSKELVALQRLINDIYSFAVRKDKHVLAYNIIVVLSQIPYQYLGSWACMVAIAATRNKYQDVVEVGIRCFENWENREACSFLSQCSFSETWLQEYANEVCAYLAEDGKDINVLLEKNLTWQMAGERTDSTSNLEGYRSGHSSSGV